MIKCFLFDSRIDKLKIIYVVSETFNYILNVISEKIQKTGTNSEYIYILYIKMFKTAIKLV